MRQQSGGIPNNSRFLCLFPVFLSRSQRTTSRGEEREESAVLAFSQAEEFMGDRMFGVLFFFFHFLGNEDWVVLGHVYIEHPIRSIVGLMIDADKRRDRSIRNPSQFHPTHTTPHPPQHRVPPNPPTNPHNHNANNKQQPRIYK